MSPCAETWERACELLCAHLPRDLVLLVLAYWGLPAKCILVFVSLDRYSGSVAGTEWWRCLHCPQIEPRPFRSETARSTQAMPPGGSRSLPRSDMLTSPWYQPTMPTCAETWERTCDLLCAHMPRELAVVVLGYWGLPKGCLQYCVAEYCPDGTSRSGWRCLHCPHIEPF